MQNNSSCVTLSVSSTPGCILLQCFPNGSADYEQLRFPSMGSRGWVVHGSLFHALNPWLYGLPICHAKGLSKRGKEILCIILIKSNTVACQWKKKVFVNRHLDKEEFDW